jgi:hypothetical protein
MTVASVEVASCGFAVVPAGFSGETMDHLIEDVALRSAPHRRAGIRYAMRVAAVEVARRSP